MKGGRTKAKCLAVLGTGSDVGKSVVATALCRILSDRGYRVAPFKAQNMSNNSGVTPEGLEMGRAQIVQAEAARLAPRVDMNPVLLKPDSETGSQVVLLGRPLTSVTARHYHDKRSSLFRCACAALDRLREDHDAVILEGAGSCTEMNLMGTDIVNLRMAAYAGAPVLLVADIHRGGVFAQLLGTLECLEPTQRKRIAGFLINRFRGDLSLFAGGAAWIEKRTGRRVFGVLPWFTHISIEAEDSVVLEKSSRPPSPGPVSDPAVAVICLPHISNFTDCDALCRVKGLSVHFLESPQDLSPYRAVILPGSKSTRHDLRWLHATGWARHLREYERRDGFLLGVCGGFQMLGTHVHDPQGVEGPPGFTEGLGLLPVTTTLHTAKTTTLSQFTLKGASGTGYEIHMGRTRRLGAEPWLAVTARNRQPLQEEEGCVSASGRVMGTYMHGIFDTPEILASWLEWVGIGAVEVPAVAWPMERDRQYDLLAEHFAAHVDVDAIVRVLETGSAP